MARIHPKKGLDLLAPAFARAYQRLPNVHLVVAGPDSSGFASTANNYFMQAGCIGAVTFTGMLTGTLKSSVLAASSIYVAPSYSEGFSMSVLEGMATGLPCIITTGCNFPEAAANNTAKVVGINEEQIGDALIELLESPLTAKKMGDRASKFIRENYTWDKIAIKLIDVYQEILTQQ